MGGIEIARIRAAALHGGLTADGADSWSPAALVAALAQKVGVRIIPVPKDDPRLEGSEGVWDPDTRYVYHALSGNVFRDAFVAAHEIGHAVIGGSSTKSFSRTIDPTRAAEDPEIGADRIWDYSRRERKEVAMDLFARELLMPRSWLRRRVLDDEIRIDEIAARLGAPYEVVAQQALDALLLPEPMERTGPDARATPPQDDSQRDAATHSGSPFLLEAGPGTGKTKTLVARVEHLLDRGVDPSQILVLTFSNRAAAELTERIAQSRSAEAATMWIGTFHSFGLDLIRRFSGELDLPSDPRLLDLSSAVDLVEDEFARLPLAHYRDLYDPLDHIVGLLRAVSRAKDEVVSPQRYRELAAATALRDPVEGAKAVEVAVFYEAYERLKKSAGAVDFGDLVLLPVTLVENHPAMLAGLRDRHRHILVDEYQDVNHASVRLLSSLAGTGENLWAVGDARQSIYRFRGASSANMDIFRRTFPSATFSRLETNYRSTTGIVGLFNAFSLNMGVGSLPGPSPRPAATGPQPELHVCGDRDSEPDAIAASAHALHRAGHAWRNQAILVKGNDRLAEVARRLEALGVPVLFLGVLFEREEVRDLLSILSLAHDGYGSALARLAAMPDLRMSASDAMALSDALRIHEASSIGWHGIGLRRDGLSTEALTALDRLDAIFANHDGRLSPWLACVRAVLDETSIARRLATSDSIADRAKGIAMWQFLNYARTQTNGKPWPTTHEFLARIRRIVRFGDERDLRRLPPSADHLDAVRMMTIHGAKGLEFDVVHLPGLHARGMPGNRINPHCIPPDGMIVGSEGETGDEAIKAGLDEEMKCLFYVALSRAKQSLVMYRQSVKANPSKFLDGLGSHYAESIAGKVAAAGLADSVKTIPVTFASGITITASKLGAYARCPRRFFYTYVLGLGGRREETPYTMMHNAIQRLVEMCGSHPPSEAIKRSRFDAMFQEAWSAKGPIAHGYSDGYRAMAIGLADTLWTEIQGRARHEPGRLELRLAGGTVLADVDHISREVDGTIHLRRVRTGKSSSSDLKALENRLSRLAAQGLGTGIRFSLINLADAAVRDMPAPLAADRADAEVALARIASGDFPQVVDSRRCPKCPHYFLCGETGEGGLTARL